MHTLLNPCYVLDGETVVLPARADGVFRDIRLRAEVERTLLAPGRERLRYRWLNQTDKPITCQLEIHVRAEFAFAHYVIPGVSLDGNPWGTGKEPKGLALHGEPWVFDYRRTTIPSCTISENEAHFLALMASDADAASLECACSMTAQRDGCMLHRLIYPCVERTLTYCTRDGYADAHETFLTLAPGEALVTTAYVLYGKPCAADFATANVQDAALELLGKPFPPKYTARQTAELCSCFAQSLLMETNGRSLFSIGQLPGEDGAFTNRKGHEFGWCGQNGMYARLFLEKGLATGDARLAAIGTDVLNAFSHEAVGATGLIHTHYHWMLDGHSDVEDTCNQGFAIAELTRAWQVAKTHGVDQPDWLRAAMCAADFLLAHVSTEFGFGKSWNVETGDCIDPQGTIGAYVIPGLVALYHATGRKAYLSGAQNACRLYRDRDLHRFQCAAGALDTCCIDKESSGPLLAGSLALYEVKPAEEWLDCAKKAGWYFCSWMFHHDAFHDPTSDFAVYGYRMLGGTSVSAQHHHIDPWGALVVPQLLRLWQITGDERWRKRAHLMWANAIQNIAPEEGKRIHGRLRPPGAQNEGYHHCRWGETGAPGHINEWLVAWPQAFCWNTANHLMELGYR